MDNFHDIYLPDFIAVHVRGGPEFFTNVIRANSGREVRNIEREIALNKYSISSCKLSKQQFNELNSFFRARMGKAISFRFKDHLDCKIEKQILNAEDNLNFKIHKYYTDNKYIYEKRITKPVFGTVKVWIDNAPYADAKINYLEGIITLGHPLPKESKLLVSLEFDLVVRFNSDFLSSYVDLEDLIIIENLEFIEVLE